MLRKTPDQGREHMPTVTKQKVSLILATALETGEADPGLRVMVQVFHLLLLLKRLREGQRGPSRQSACCQSPEPIWKKERTDFYK